VRDGVLRCSECGYELFNYLYQDYYGFSPEVCRLMARSPALQELIRARYLAPLTAALEMLRAHSIDRVDATELGARFDSLVKSSPDLSALTQQDLALARAVLMGTPFPEVGVDLAPDLASLVRERAWPSPYVKWMLIDPIDMLSDALVWRLEGLGSDEIGRRLGERFDEWSVQMPLTPVWSKLSRYTLNEEFAFLENTLLRQASTRYRFGQRLTKMLPADKASLVEARWGVACHEK